MPAEYLRRGWPVCVGRRAQVELHRDDEGPSEERDEEGGVVTLGASAGRCPGPAAAEVEPRLLRTNGACERAVCLRYGQLVTDLVDGRLLALLTTRYGASRSHIRQAKRYLGCELVHLCALTLGHSEPSCGLKINATSCLLDIRTAGLPSWRRVASLSLGPSVPRCARSSNS